MKLSPPNCQKLISTGLSLLLGLALFPIAVRGAVLTIPPATQYNYLDDADTNQAPVNVNSFRFDQLPFPRTGTGENIKWGISLPGVTASDFTKDDIVSGTIGSLDKTRAILDLNSNILGLHYLNVREYAVFTQVDGGIVFTNTGPVTDATTDNMFAGHWLYYAGTTLATAVNAATQTFQVANGGGLKNNMTGGVFDNNDGPPGSFVVIYDPPVGSFANAEFVFMTNLTGNTFMSRERGYKSTALTHPIGAIVAELSVSGSTTASHWSYNRSTYCPRDNGGSGKTFGERMADWIKANIETYHSGSTTGQIAPNQPGGVGILFDADTPSMSGNPDYDNDGVAGAPILASGLDPVSAGTDLFYSLVRSNHPNKVIIGGYVTSRGFTNLNGVQLEEAMPEFTDKFEDVLANYTFRIHEHRLGATGTEVLMRDSTALYPHGLAVPSTLNLGFRQALGFTLLDDGYFSYSAKFSQDISQERADFWWDEYTVSVAADTATFGQAFNVTNTSLANMLLYGNWLGRALGPRDRLYNASVYGTNASLLKSANYQFEANTTGWTASNGSLTRDSVNPGQGGFSLKFAPSTNTASVTGPTITLLANTNYTISFMARAAQSRSAQAGLDNAVHDIYLSTNWQRIVLTVASGGGGSHSPKFTFNGDQTTVWLDDVYLFTNTTAVFYREFENGAVLVNGTSDTNTVQLSRWFKRILGTTSQRATDPADPNTGVVQAPGSTVTLPPWDAIELVKIPLAGILGATNASEIGLVNGGFAISRDCATNFPLTVSYSLGGSATNGVDYATMSSSVTIPAGQLQAAVTIAPLSDHLIEGVRTVNLTVTNGLNYVTNVFSSSSITIADDPVTPRPVALRGTLVASNQIALTWTDQAANETGFELQRRLISGTFATIAAVPAQAGIGGNVSYNDTSIVVGASYSYRVRATNVVGQTSWSDETTNQAPMLVSISNVTNNVGITLNLNNTATDSDIPPQILTFSLLSAPTNAALNATNGVFTWRPLATQANSNYPILLAVTDNGTPSLSATQGFSIMVNPVNRPRLISPVVSNGQFSLVVTGDYGPDYILQSSTNLNNWNTLLTTNSPHSPFWMMDTSSVATPQRFYRILLQ
ncbi:MAG: carbohydrate binding domain-containing protein [Verrucomicrobiae bacterium]